MHEPGQQKHRRVSEVRHDVAGAQAREHSAYSAAGAGESRDRSDFRTTEYIGWNGLKIRHPQAMPERDEACRGNGERRSGFVTQFPPGG